MHIFCDFDGTISLDDTTDVILERFADPEWEIIERQWKAGEIGSAECMRRQIQLIDVDLETLNTTLDNIEIDPGFTSFVRLCHAERWGMTVLSDGIHYFIQRILKRNGIEELPIIANRLLFCGDGRHSLESPYRDDSCASKSGVCKCKKVNASDDFRVYIGDGRSDFCAAPKADLIFAKGALAIYCEQRDISFFAFESFDDVAMTLTDYLSSRVPERPARVQAFA